MDRFLAMMPALVLGSLVVGCSGAPPDGGADYTSDPTTGSRPPHVDPPSAAPPGPMAGNPPAPTASPVTPAAAPWCSTHPATFCADFDTGSLPAGFSAMNGGLLSIGLAGTRPLTLKVPTAMTGSTYSSRLSQPFTRTSSDMTLAFDISPAKLNTDAGSLLVAAVDFFGNSQGWYSVRVTFVNGRARIEESMFGSADVHHPYFDLPLAKWSRVKLDIVLDGNSKSVKLSVNDSTVGAIEPLTPPPGVDLHPTLLIGGVYGTTPQDGWQLSYDNVTMDLR